MVGSIPLGPGYEVSRGKAPSALHFFQGIEFPVNPNDFRFHLAGDTLQHHGVAFCRCGQAVGGDLNDGVDAHVAGFGGAVFIAADGFQRHHVPLGVLVIGQLAAVQNIRIFQQLAYAVEVTGIDAPAVFVKQIADFVNILHEHRKRPFTEMIVCE